MKTFHRNCILAAALLALASSPAAIAAIHCVDSALELQQALVTAAATAGDDEVRVVAGTYIVPPPPSNGFRYVSSQAGDLVVSGGWDPDAPVGIPPGCEVQVPDPALTVLDAQYQIEALVLQPGPASGDLAVHNLTLTQGSSAGNGGGLYAAPYDEAWVGNTTLQSLRVLANEALQFGAGLYVSVPRGYLRVQNAAVVGNVSGLTGAGAVLLANGEDSIVANLTVAGNSSGATFGAGLMVGGTIPVLLMNSVLWGNTPDDLQLNGDAIRLHHNFYDSRIGMQPSDEFGTLNGNPMLAGGSLGLTPTAGSPLVDHGLPVPGGLPTRDVDAGQRVVGPGVDIGAFEAQIFADGYEGADDWERPPPVIPQ